MNDSFNYYHCIHTRTDGDPGFLAFAHRRNSFAISRQPQDPLSFSANAYELYMLVDGVCNILVGERIFTPRPGDIFLYQVDQPHRLIIRSEQFERFVLHFSPNVFDSIVSSRPLMSLFQTPEAQQNQIVLPDEATHKILATLQNASAVIRENRPDTSYLVFAAALQVLSALRHSLQNTAPRVLGSDCPRILNEVIDYIHASYRSMQGLQEVCDRFGISRAYLSRLFARYTVVTPSRYIRDLKLNYAKQLLSHGANVTEACFESGFSDYSNFIRLFHKETGVTPLTYKQQLKMEGQTSLLEP